MAELVAQAVREQRPLVAEAGTGTGKTMGYSIPLLVARKKFLIATHTKALQEQIYHKDMPYMAEALRDRFGLRFEYALLKGAANYLCVRRFNELTGGLFDTLNLPASVVEWGRSTPSGGLDEAPGMEDLEVRRSVAVDLNDCDRGDCPFYGQCHYRKARDAAASADVAIVNHAWLAVAAKSPFVMGQMDPDAIVIDEAHQWEAVVRESCSAHLSGPSLKNLFDSIAKHVHSTCQAPGRDQYDAAKERLRAAALKVMGPYMDPADKREEYLVDIQHLKSVSEEAKDAVADFLSVVRDHLDENDAKHQRIARMLDKLGELFESVHTDGAIAVAHREVPDGAKLAKVKIETFPLSIAGTDAGRLHRMVPIIYTSATLSIGGSFEAFKEAHGLPDSTLEAEIASPFNYPRQALLYVPTHITPRREDPRYFNDLAAEIERLVTKSDGQAFVLFTSRVAMEEAAKRLRHLPFPKKKQAETGSKQALVDWFKETPKAVLFGLASFWEGVSIEGDQLRLVIIDKLPFPVPTEPLHQAKEAHLRAQGRDPFRAHSLPAAILKLKQGFGRLIRTQSDRGMVAILDARIHQKYARPVLAALPDARRIYNLDDSVLISRYFGFTDDVLDESPEDQWGAGF